MIKTTNFDNDKLNNEAVNTPSLMKILDCGRATAVQIGTDAGAKLCVGRRVLWNLPKIRDYLSKISC